MTDDVAALSDHSTKSTLTKSITSRALDVTRSDARAELKSMVQLLMSTEAALKHLKCMREMNYNFVPPLYISSTELKR